ncbi:hypothetical protein SmJEL517_g03337 [Synchytrium microbalum]|uniref:Photolyase/cryptochrome alpha/beta domain-containing protein n=1 Tax=Synchytrium microbalum TaxID=1806994 RepID=A0A507C3D2_9FUNG|nr:uncharacterized protein SmJEL517_g03337 [Synchytrium microbalum]TPX33888.1 hypothetical protein SmJEL517_g03337 [Synchytrium microbalum]
MSKTIVWFRKSLRVHDNPALLQGSLNCQNLYPIFCFDPHYVFERAIGVRRWIFLLEALRDLDANLRKVNSRLYVFRGDPIKAMPTIMAELGINHIAYEIDTDTEYAVMRDKKVDEIAKGMGVKVTAVLGHTMYDAKAVAAKNGGKPPMTYQSFLKAISSMPDPPTPLTMPTRLPPPAPIDMMSESVPLPVHKSELPPTRDTTDIEAQKKLFASLAGPNGNFDVPTLEELGLVEPPVGERSPHRGGESVALKLLDAFIAQKKRVAKFEKPKTSPAAFYPNADTTVLSPHLKFGSLSCRLFRTKILQVYREEKSHSQPPTSLLGQLLWREFYYAVAALTPNYSTMANNKACLYIPWRDTSKDATAAAHLKAWSEGKTGFPWIDAIMRQLAKEGWIHHLARHSVACFLTRGDLWISWERGVEVFDELLLDSDPSLNIGNWLWLSASQFFHTYYRVYSPIAFGKQYDKEGIFIKRYVPELSKMPEKYIFTPWLAPIDVQRKAGCIIGVDYPKPIVEHDVASKANMAKMKEAYAKKIYGWTGNEVHVASNPAMGVESKEGGNDGGDSSEESPDDGERDGAEGSDDEFDPVVRKRRRHMSAVSEQRAAKRPRKTK